jgi:hypothetical protein
MPAFPAPSKLRPAVSIGRGGNATANATPMKVRAALDAMHADPAHAQRVSQGVRSQFEQRAKWYGGLSTQGKLDALHAGSVFTVASIQTETGLAEFVTRRYLADAPSLDARIRLGAAGTGSKLKQYMREHNAQPGVRGTGLAYNQKGAALHQNAVILSDWQSIVSKPDFEQRLLISGFHADSSQKLTGMGYPKAAFAIQLGTGAGRDMAVMDIHNVSALGLERKYAQLPRAHAVRVTQAMEALVRKHTGLPAGEATWTAWSIGVTGDPVPHRDVFTAMGVQ